MSVEAQSRDPRVRRKIERVLPDLERKHGFPLRVSGGNTPQLLYAAFDGPLRLELQGLVPPAADTPSMWPASTRWCAAV